ncbi:hypothetical protein GVN22_27690, partial [Cellulophaga sp. BC115SP]|nr:hypothetical protein [Cellulophaga sp. BC115SP]
SHNLSGWPLHIEAVYCLVRGIYQHAGDRPVLFPVAPFCGLEPPTAVLQPLPN